MGTLRDPENTEDRDVVIDRVKARNPDLQLFEGYVNDRTREANQALDAATERIDSLIEASEFWRLKSPVQRSVLEAASGLVAVIEWCDSWQDPIGNSRQ